MLISILCGFAGDIIAGAVAGVVVGSNAVDWYSSVGAVMGFMSPVIVYIGNHLG